MYIEVGDLLVEHLVQAGVWATGSTESLKGFVAAEHKCLVNAIRSGQIQFIERLRRTWLMLQKNCILYPDFVIVIDYSTLINDYNKHSLKISREFVPILITSNCKCVSIPHS